MIDVGEVKMFLNYTDTTYDTRIRQWIPYARDRVIRICNNQFTDHEIETYGGEYVFSTGNTIYCVDGDFTEEGFVAGDWCRVKGSVKNDGTYKIATVTSTLLTVTDEFEMLHEDTDAIGLLRTVYITYVRFPKAIKPVVANMIRYDMTERANRTGVASERIGNYSVSYHRAASLGFDYPDDIIGGLDPWVVPAGG
jgi:hypothetical protein